MLVYTAAGGTKRHGRTEACMQAVGARQLSVNQWCTPFFGINLLFLTDPS